MADIHRTSLLVLIGLCSVAPACAFHVAPQDILVLLEKFRISRAVVICDYDIEEKRSLMQQNKTWLPVFEFEELKGRHLEDNSLVHMRSHKMVANVNVFGAAMMYAVARQP